MEREAPCTKFNSEQTFGKFFLKVLIMIIPAIIFGLLIDNSIIYLQYIMGNDVHCSLWCILQTCIIVMVMYGLHVGMSWYADEFQTTLSGLFFVSLYFGIQSNYYTTIHTVADQISVFLYSNYQDPKCVVQASVNSS